MYSMLFKYDRLKLLEVLQLVAEEVSVVQVLVRDSAKDERRMGLLHGAESFLECAVNPSHVLWCREN